MPDPQLYHPSCLRTKDVSRTVGDLQSWVDRVPWLDLSPGSTTVWPVAVRCTGVHKLTVKDFGLFVHDRRTPEVLQVTADMVAALLWDLFAGGFTPRKSFRGQPHRPASFTRISVYTPPIIQRDSKLGFASWPNPQQDPVAFHAALVAAAANLDALATGISTTKTDLMDAPRIGNLLRALSASTGGDLPPITF